MKLLKRWQEQKLRIETMLAEGRINPQAAAQMLAHLDYRIKRRPLILKRRRDRKAWRNPQSAELRRHAGPTHDSDTHAAGSSPLRS